MRLIRNILRLLILAVVVISGWVYFTYTTVSDLPPLKTGDLVFQTVDTSQTIAILLASHSVYSHVGIVKMVGDEPHIIDAAEPVREVSLDEWMKQGVLGRITIKRLPDLSPEDAQRIVAQAETYMGKSYDYHFTFGEDKIYCSELVHHAFSPVLGYDVGKVEKVSELAIDNSFAQTVIDKRWKSHPLCQAEDIGFDECFEKIMNQELITPAAIEKDAKLVQVYSNYLPF